MFFVLVVLYKLLVKARIVPADCKALEIKQLWFRCQALFIRFIETAMKMADDDVRFSLTWTSACIVVY